MYCYNNQKTILFGVNKISTQNLNTNILFIPDIMHTFLKGIIHVTISLTLLSLYNTELINIESIK